MSTANVESEKVWMRYIPAILAAVVAFIGLVIVLARFTGSDEDWADISRQLEDTNRAAAQAEVVALESKDWVGCVTSKTAGAMGASILESVQGVPAGVCQIPSVTLDITLCLAFRPVAPVVEAVVEGAAVVAPAPVEGEVVVIAGGVDVPAAVTLSVSPILTLARTIVSATKASPQTQAWALGVTLWVESGYADVIALIQNPGTGVLTLEGQTIEGCTP